MFRRIDVFVDLLLSAVEFASMGDKPKDERIIKNSMALSSPERLDGMILFLMFFFIILLPVLQSFLVLIFAIRFNR